jgi:tRNA(Ile)-lysidine synthase
MSYINAVEFADLMPILSPGTSVAVAVSGGSDSLCLGVLLARWCANYDCDLTVLTVDHGVRPESAAECLFVKRFFADTLYKAKTQTLRCHIPKPVSMDGARQARYKVLADYCHMHNIDHMFVGHHQNDGWETFFFRLGRGSGLRGLLTPFKPQNELNRMIKLDRPLRIYRPLINCSKKLLQNTLRHLGIETWVEDPTNQNLDYSRNKIRHHLEGFYADNTKGLAKSLQALQRAEAALDFYQAKIDCIWVSSQHVVIKSLCMDNHAPEILGRVLESAIHRITGRYIARSRGMNTLISRLGQGKTGTLGLCRFVWRGSDLHIMPERKDV